MDNVINNKGEELNAHFKVVTIDNQLGLTLESRNGLKRNRDYNEALEIILDRLKKRNIVQVKLKVVSANLLKNMPNPSDRVIKINEKPEVILKGTDIKQLRKQIGSAAANGAFYYDAQELVVRLLLLSTTSPSGRRAAAEAVAAIAAQSKDLASSISDLLVRFTPNAVTS